MKKQRTNTLLTLGRMFSLLALFTALLSFNSSCQQPAGSGSTGVKNADPSEFKTLLENKESVLLDVRTPQEFAEGHIAGAVNINFESPTFKDDVSKLDKSKTYNVYCRSGRRSAAAADVMNSNGFKDITNLKGGILGWQEKGFETTKE